MEQKGTAANQDEIRIDLVELLYEFRRKWWILLLSLVIGGGVGFLGSKFLLIPKYTSTATLYVLSKDTTLTSLADLQIGSQLTNDYKVVVTSRPILQKVIDGMELDWRYQKLKKMVSIDNPTGTRILEISITDTDPVRTCQLTNSLAKAASDYIADIMEMTPPKFIEEAIVAEKPISPHVTKNAMLAAAGCLFLVCAVITVRMVMDDTIQGEDDIERYLGVPVLGLIPEKSGASGTASRGDRKTSRKRPAGEKTAGERAGGEKPAGAKSAGEKPAGEKKNSTGAESKPVRKEADSNGAGNSSKNGKKDTQ